MSDECQHETICSDCGAMTTGYAALTARAEAAEQQAARLRAALRQIVEAPYTITGGTETILDRCLGIAVAALGASQPAPAAEAMCHKTLDCTKQAGHDSWCTVVLISDVSRCPSIYSSPGLEGVRCWRPAGHEGVHEDRGLRWDAPRRQQGEQDADR